MHLPKKPPLYKRITLFAKMGIYVIVLSSCVCIFVTLGYAFGALEWFTRTVGSYIMGVTDKVIAYIRLIITK